MGRKLQAVLFDLGGTLLYSDATWPEIMERAIREMLSHLRLQGVALEDTFLAEFRKRLDEYYVQREAEFIEPTTAYLLRTFLQDLGQPEPAPELVRSALRAFYAVSQSHWIAEEDAVPTLQSLQDAGYRLGAISNASDDADVQLLVDRAGLRPYFDFVLTSAACGIRKPNPRIFHIALDNWGLPPEATAMVGDTLGADVLGARNAGLLGVWITKRAETPGNRDHLDTIEPDLTVASLAELPAALAAVS
jgi:putative hydrolase of the HAD superfamily